MNRRNSISTPGEEELPTEEEEHLAGDTGARARRRAHGGEG